jgi:hypothetical protein
MAVGMSPPRTVILLPCWGIAAQGILTPKTRERHDNVENWGLGQLIKIISSWFEIDVDFIKPYIPFTFDSLRCHGPKSVFWAEHKMGPRATSVIDVPENSLASIIPPKQRWVWEHLKRTMSYFGGCRQVIVFRDNTRVHFAKKGQVIINPIAIRIGGYT